jgi:PPOX class probable F420-dependent enzyme
MLNDRQRAFLREPRFAVVATIAKDGLPHQTVMWFMLDDDGDGMLLNTPNGSLKHKHLLRDPRISVCVEDKFTYITLTGTVTINEDPVQSRADYQRLGQHYMAAMSERPAAPPANMNPKLAELISRERVTLRMKIDKVQANGLD